MTVLPDTVMPEGPLRRQRLSLPLEQEDVPDTLMRICLRCAGAGAVIAAFGVWLMPTLPEDAAMQLIKLLLSVTLMIGGAIVLTGTRTVTAPEIRLDTRNRRLMILQHGADGKLRSEVTHDVDALSQIVLRDHLLTASDAQGRPLLTLPIHNRQAEQAIRAMLSGECPGARAA